MDALRRHLFSLLATPQSMSIQTFFYFIRHVSIKQTNTLFTCNGNTILQDNLLPDLLNYITLAQTDVFLKHQNKHLVHVFVCFFLLTRLSNTSASQTQLRTLANDNEYMNTKPPTPRAHWWKAWQTDRSTDWPSCNKVWWNHVALQLCLCELTGNKSNSNGAAMRFFFPLPVQVACSLLPLPSPSQRALTVLDPTTGIHCGLNTGGCLLSGRDRNRTSGHNNRK